MNGDKSFAGKVQEGLRQQPAYLLVFGICVIFGGGSAYWMIGGSEMSERALSLVGFVIALAGALITVWIVESSTRQPRARSTKPAEERAGVAELSFTEVKEEDFQQLLSVIRDHVKEALSFGHPVFYDAMRRDLNRWSGQSLHWSKGEYRARTDYAAVLHQFYSQAERTVFSTCLPDYLPTWSTVFGSRLLEAHQNSQAAVTRVFVFDKHQSVTPEHRKILEEHLKQRKITSLIYFDKQDNSFRFPPSLSKDFTVIDDGAAIGITVSFGEDNLEARWQFDRTGTANPVKEETLDVRKRLLAVSTPLEEWLKGSTEPPDENSREAGE